MEHNIWRHHAGSYQTLEDFPEGCIGFVYMIKNQETGNFYIGKKSLHHNIKRKIGKKEKLLFEGKGRKPSFERIQKESDWKTYYGSSKPFLEELKKYGPSLFEKTILDFAFNKRQLTYLEVKHQFKNNALEDAHSMNDNILGKFYRKDLE